MIRIEWDEPKRLENITAHEGLDFADLTEEFFERSVHRDSYRKRVMATGEFRDLIITVVFSYLGTEAISIISMRRADRGEREFFHEHRT